MSNVTNPNTGSNESPNEGLGQELNLGAGSPAILDTASDSSEEGEIRDDPPPEEGELQEDPSVEKGELQDDRHTGEKRKRPTSDEDQPAPKRARSGPAPTVPSFANLPNPMGQVPCIIRINAGEPFGSLYPVVNSLENVLFIDPGRFGPPTVSISFLNSRGRDVARINWDMESNLRGEWVMKDIEHGYAPTHGPDLRMSDPTVLAKFQLQDARNLLCMRFTSRSQILGFKEKGAFDDQSHSIQHSLRTMFRRQESYTLEIWFIAPYDATNFRRDYIGVFIDCERNRVDPLHHWKDQGGV